VAHGLWVDDRAHVRVARWSASSRVGARRPFSGRFAALNAAPADGRPRRPRCYGFVDRITSCLIAETAGAGSSRGAARAVRSASRPRCCTP
jgi:hypothetical protein